MLPVGGRHSLAGVGYGDCVFAVGMLQRGGYSAFGRSVFQGIGHKVEVDVGYLLLVGDYHAADFFLYVYVKTDVLPFGYHTEIIAPCAQFCGKAEAVERERCLFVLNLPELKYFAHHLLQDAHVAAYHLHKFALFATNAVALGKLVGRT